MTTERAEVLAELEIVKEQIRQQVNTIAFFGFGGKKKLVDLIKKRSELEQKALTLKEQEEA